MTRTLALALCLSCFWTGIATAQYAGYPPAHVVSQPAIVHAAQPISRVHVRGTHITSHPYHEPTSVHRVAPTYGTAYGTADVQPMLQTNYGCNGHCMGGALPPRSTVLQPVGVPSLGAYVPAAMPAPAYPPAYPPAANNSVTEGYNVGRGLFGSPKFYRTGEPIRNMLRFLTL